MNCPRCKAPSNRVADSRPLEEGTAIRRRRTCLKCGERWTTYERLESPYAETLLEASARLERRLALSLQRFRSSLRNLRR